ncbi:NAD(P)H-dependent glycerol-3-phosphate dehydrogenase [Chloroflexota bacterium]
MPKIAIIGTTSWGIALGMALARDGVQVSLWARTEQEALQLVKEGPYPDSDSNISFPATLCVTSSISDALFKAKAVILPVPSPTIRQNTRLISGYLDKSMLIVSGAKGLEIGSGKRMTQVIAEEIEPGFQSNICVLSGPNLSQEILIQLPAASVVAAESQSTARKAQKLLTTPSFCVFINTDIIGVEMGSALKNIIALGAGITDGLGLGDNAKAALITRGLTEITALGVALGANPLTFSGLTGLGDLIATCASSQSRNHYVGEQLTKGRLLKEITDSMTGVAEGVSTTLAVWHLAQKTGLEMPITETMYRVLYEGADIRESVTELMQAGAAHELAGRKWELFSNISSHPNS